MSFDTYIDVLSLCAGFSRCKYLFVNVLLERQQVVPLVKKHVIDSLPEVVYSNQGIASSSSATLQMFNLFFLFGHFVVGLCLY
ncbi:hypothetical protein Bca4012_057698 [Brassica carinata]